MTLRHFRIFVEVCDTMNMTQAAERLFMSQSAVSQAIAEMEAHYGVRLFERLSRKLYLTQAGRELLGYARHMIGMNAQIEADMKTLQRNGLLRIGASVTVGAHVLPELVAEFRKVSAETRIQVEENNTAAVENMILQDGVDFGLVEGETVSPDVRSRAFLEDELVLICGAGHPFASEEVVEPHELEREPFIIREKGSGTRRTFEDKMAANDLSFQTAWTCNNADTIKNAVAVGLGVSVISWRAVQDEVRAGRLCRKRVRGIEFKRWFKEVHHKNKYFTEPMKKFMSLLNV